jgi:hypothetical protein
VITALQQQQQQQLCALCATFDSYDFFIDFIFQTSTKVMDEFSAIGFGLGLMCYARNRKVFDDVLIYEELLKDPSKVRVFIV